MRECILTAYDIDLGAAYGTAKSGVGICSMGVLKPDLIFKSIVPIIMAGILGIYGLIVAVILNNKGKHRESQSLVLGTLRGDWEGLKRVKRITTDKFVYLVNVTEAQNGNYKFGDGYKHLASGLVCGLSSLVSAEGLFTI